MPYTKANDPNNSSCEEYGHGDLMFLGEIEGEAFYRCLICKKTVQLGEDNEEERVVEI